MTLVNTDMIDEGFSSHRSLKSIDTLPCFYCKKCWMNPCFCTKLCYRIRVYDTRYGYYKSYKKDTRNTNRNLRYIQRTVGGSIRIVLDRLDRILNLNCLLDQRRRQR
jgi:hypothetical protein